jgi:tagatose 6-phosphate kinase
MQLPSFTAAYWKAQMNEADAGYRHPYDVVVISPNSALDSYYLLPCLSVGSVNRAEGAVHTAGGKGNNMARAVKALGGSVLSLGILGGHSGKFVIDELEREGIPSDIVWVNHETRRSSTIIVPGEMQTTVVLDSGNPVQPEDGDLLIQKVREQLLKAPFLVLTGSLPHGLAPNYYARVINCLSGAGSPAVCLDCSGEVLMLAAEAGAKIIKVNVQEYQATFGNGKAWDWKNAQSTFANLRSNGTELLIITAGAEGAYVFHIDSAPYCVTTQITEFLSTAGAGDSFLAGLLVALGRGDSIEQATCYGSASAAAKLKHIVCGDLDLADIEQLLSQTYLTPLV